MFRAITVALCLIAVGCGPLTVPANPDEKHDTPIVERATSENIWQQLGGLVDAGHIKTTTALSQVVVALINNGDLATSDAGKFDSAFPNATTSSRELTKDDATKLKGIK